MIKKLLLIGCFLSLFTSSLAQTTLSPGDIAIIGVNFDDFTNYELTIVTLAPIAANTQIRISDYWYNENTPNKLTNITNTGTALTSEGSILWQPTEAIPAGTVYKISIVQEGNTVTGLPGNVSVTGWSTPIGTPSSQGGDNWFIYQGTSVTDVTNFVFLWGNGSPRTINSFTVTPGQFVPSGSGNLSSNLVTYLPTPSLTLGTNAIALTVDPTLATGGLHGDNNAYTGIKEGTKAALLAAICNTSNWIKNELTTYDINPGGTTFPGTNPIFSVTNNSAPTDIALSNTSINENVAANSTVGTLSTTDPDSGNTFTYTLVAGAGSTDNASFSISGNNLTINASPNFETKSSYSVRIRTTDQGNLTFEKVFTITINNVNETPTDITLSDSDIDENVVANSTVGALSSTDPDAGNTFTYTLVAGAGSTDNASFSISGNNLTINASPNFETKSSYSVRIRTTDQGSLTFEKAFTISITNVNEAPTDITLSAAAINENVPANSTVGALSSTDVDNSSFTYSLAAGAGDTDNAAITISGSDLKITASPDFETKSSYSVRIRTTDQGGLTFEKAFTITINNVNEAPTDIALSNTSINENVSANSAVGALSSTDPDSGNTFTYNLVAGAGSTDNASFSITGNSVTINASPDFETKSFYSVRIRTTDQGSLTFEKAFTITINDVSDINQAPTDITLSAAAIDENVAANSTVGTLSSTDGDTSSFTYSLVAGTGDADNAVFTISGSDLKIIASPDFETKASYSVRVRTFDGTSTFEKAFTVSINDLNEAPTDITLSATAIDENVAANSTVGTLSSTDGDTSSFTYSLVAGTGDTDNAVFSISGSDLKIIASPDFETKASYSVRIRTFDGTSTFEKAFTISINDINEAPTDIALSALVINERVATNSTVGAFTSTDFDSGNTFTYSLVNGLGDADNASFSISGATLLIATSPDFETKASYSIRVKATDQNGLFFEKQFTITINDVCELDGSLTLANDTLNPTQTNVSCNGGTNGSASVTPPGGAGGYTYSWSPSGGTAATATGLAAGSYTVTITGANSCTTTRNFTITQPTAIAFTTTVLSDYDYNTGYSQTIATSGGTGTKTYAVTAGSLPSGFSLSTAGEITGISTQIANSTFTVTATDANGCTATYNYVLKLNQIPITVTATPSQTKVYGESDPVLTYTVSPSLLPGDSFTGSLTRVSGEDIGNYAIDQGSLSAGSNYLITYVGANLTITAKPITVTATPSQTKVYGATDPVFVYSVSPSLVGSDSFTGALTRAAGENAGTYAINQGSLSAGSNYTITYVRKDFTITAKPITVTANASQSKVYGTIDPVFTYTVSPSLVSGDSFTGALTRVDGVNVGVYPITQGTLSAGSNYTIQYNSSNFTITKADQVITWNQTLGLGCNGETSLVLTAVATSGSAINYTSSNPTIASVSNNSLLFQNYGAATITASQPGNMNYNAAPPVVLPVVASQPNLIRKQFENIIFFDNSSKSFKSYSWYKNGVLVPSQTSQYFKESGALNGTYYAVATKLDGTLITTCPLTLSPSVEDEYIRIVPNPVRSNASFQLTTNVSSSKLQNARVELFNLIGNLLTTINTSQNTTDMIAPSVEGLYIVKMTLTNGKYFTKNLLVKN
ncbi:MBG domain-containing protein [Flavobacterium sp.]|uniref:MBG domain-containing protein n=1 Tax=Flavobacterium sp. TaxID=239 RepID=UPI0022C4EEEC|nr:MBG domain-containing protein [Flavobacterium sp.]MCZ8228826.1 MBG domain-containing protein [Flavobacterium sp.]